MKIVQKNWAYSPNIENAYRAIEELNEYEFNGQIDFTFSPIFLYDPDNRIAVNLTAVGAETPKMAILDEDKIVKIERIVSKSTEVYPLSRNYSLQDFFNDHANAKCIVFFLSEGTIFHEGYRIRVYIDE